MARAVAGRVKAPTNTTITATRLSSRPAPAQPIQAKGDESGDPVEQWRRASRVGHDFARLKVGAEPRGQAGGERPLPETVRRKAEHELGLDVSGVRLRVDQSPRRYGAQAFTQGDSIAVVPERYRPESRAGQELLLHEVAHVKQQRAGRVAVLRGESAPVNADSALEAEADALAAQAMRADAATGPLIAPAIGTVAVRSEASSSSAAPIQCYRSWNPRNWGKKKPLTIGTPMRAPQRPQVEGAERQRIFTEGREEAVSAAVDMIKKGESFDQIFKHLASARKEVARNQGDTNAEAFGKMRESPGKEHLAMLDEALGEKGVSDYGRMVAAGGSETALHKHDKEKDVYPGEMRRVKDRYAELRRKAAGAPKSSEPEGQAYEVEPGVKVAERGGTGAYQVSTTDEDRIPLTTTVIPPSDSEYGPKLVHTHPRHIDRLMRKAGELHSDFAKEKDQDDHVSNLGRITWLLTNAMPLHRGSASVAEWYNMAVDRAKELKLGERKGKLDLEAFRRSQDEYAQNYRDIYTKEPDEE